MFSVLYHKLYGETGLSHLLCLLLVFLKHPNTSILLDMTCDHKIAGTNFTAAILLARYLLSARVEAS